MPELQQKLNIRPPVNATENNRVVEIIKGDREIRDVLGALQQVSVVTLKPGTAAGNHVHKKKKEIIHVLNGPIRGIFEDRAAGGRLDINIEPGFRLNILPGIAHVFINETPQPVSLIEFANLPYCKENPDAQEVDLTPFQA
jgi:uncharacterized RmlC-like cupin family protein